MERERMDYVKKQAILKEARAHGIEIDSWFGDLLEEVYLFGFDQQIADHEEKRSELESKWEGELDDVYKYGYENGYRDAKEEAEGDKG